MDKGKKKGHITYRKDRKKWAVRYAEYDIITGKDKIKSKDFKTQEEAKKFLESKMYQQENPIYIKYHGIPLCEMMKCNLKLKLDTNQISEVTYHRVLITIKQIEKFPIGRKKIDEITSEELQEFMNYHKFLRNSSIKKLYQQLGTTFKIAINKGYLMRNPMENVLRPKSDKEDKEVRALTVAEQQIFTKFLINKDISNCKYKNVYLIQMFMGLRVSEALALAFGDIDLQNKIIKIKHTLTKDKDGNTIMGEVPKTKAGKRIVPIPEYLINNIIEQIQFAKQQERNDENLLFKPDDKKYTDRENVNNELKRLLKRYFGIEDITTHSLRHTYGTRCIESGMAPVVVQRLMGHADISVTLNTYTSVFEEFKQKELEKVNKYYLEEDVVNSERSLEHRTKDSEIEL